MPDIRERTDAYIHVRHQHPARQLLGARRAPLILSCLQTLFEESQNGSCASGSNGLLVVEREGRL